MGEALPWLPPKFVSLPSAASLPPTKVNVLSKNGVATSDEAGKLLSELMPQIEKTASLVLEISAASVEQNSGAMQINSAIQQLNQVTQQNAAASEEMATTSEELASQADQLKDTVSFFRTEELSHRGSCGFQKSTSTQYTQSIHCTSQTNCQGGTKEQ